MTDSPAAACIPCRGLLFDNDGVLVDSVASGEDGWRRWAKHHELDPDEVVAAIHGRRSVDTVATFLPAEQREEALRLIDRLEIDGAADGVAAMPGADALLRSLPAGAWAVVTSASRELGTARLSAAGLPYPAVLVTADDVTRGKPDPEGYLAAAAQLGTDVADCVVVEDSPAGLAAAQAAGAQVLGIGRQALTTSASVVVRDLRGVTWDGSRLHLPADALLRAG